MRTLVLLHGWGASGRLWRGVQAAARDNGRAVLAPAIPRWEAGWLAAISQRAASPGMRPGGLVPGRHAAAGGPGPAPGAGARRRGFGGRASGLLPAAGPPLGPAGGNAAGHAPGLAKRFHEGPERLRPGLPGPGRGSLPGGGRGRVRLPGSPGFPGAGVRLSQG